MRNVMIVTSGTGGHIYPGIALAYELKQSGYNPVFLINGNEASVKIIRQSDYDYKILNFEGLPRKISLKLFLFPLSLIKAFAGANKIINRISPEVIAGMGGYLSFPVLITAKIKKIPSLIHEQNCTAGLANKILSLFVDKIAVSFESSLKFFKKSKVVLTGNPVRKDIFNISRINACKELNLLPELFTVFIVGGSLGAVKLNEFMFDVINKLDKKYGGKIQVIHITGNKNFDVINDKYKSVACRKYIAPYLHAIGNAYACSDIVISRSGAGAVTEIKMYGIKAVLVPYPYATNNHQLFNAKSIEKDEYVIVCDEKDLNEKKITAFIEKNINNININNIIKPDYFPQEKLAKEAIGLIK